MHLNLLSLIPIELRSSIDKQYEILIRREPNARFTLWPEFESLILEHTNEEPIIQACKQYLAYHQCAISSLLFGLSLCTKSSACGPITSETLSEKHLYSAIRFINRHSNQIDFSWLLDENKRLWQHSCHMFLIYAYPGECNDCELITFVEKECDQSIFIRST